MNGFILKARVFFTPVRTVRNNVPVLAGNRTPEAGISAAFKALPRIGHQRFRYVFFLKIALIMAESRLPGKHADMGTVLPNSIVLKIIGYEKFPVSIRKLPELFSPGK